MPPWPTASREASRPGVVAKGDLMGATSRSVSGALCLLVLFALGGAPAAGAIQSPGEKLWGKRYNGPGDQDEQASDLAVSPDGSKVFVIGSREGSTGRDYVTVAYDASTGAELWVERFDGRGTTDLPQDVGVSPDGSTVFVTGGSFDSTASWDYATVAYEASTGAGLWAKRYDGPSNGSDIAFALGVSPDGSRLFVTGYSDGPTGKPDYTTLAYEASTGARLWLKRYDAPSNGDDIPLALRISPDGSRVFVTGRSFVPAGFDDYATVAYDASTGKEQWVSRYNGELNHHDDAWDLEVSPDGSKVYVTGESLGRMSGDYSYDYATLAYDASTGAQLWVKRYNGPANRNDRPRSLGVSPDGSKVFVTGSSEYYLNDNATSAYATLAYDASTGAQLWVKRYDGPRDGGDGATALGVSPDGSKVFVTGVSVGLTGTSDYATGAYDATTGAGLWLRRYDGRSTSYETPFALEVSPDGSRVFVTGVSLQPETTSGDDFATVAYSAR